MLPRLPRLAAKCDCLESGLESGGPSTLLNYPGRKADANLLECRSSGVSECVGEPEARSHGLLGGRFRARYRLSSLLLAIGALCVTLGLYVHRVENQRVAVAALRSAGAQVYYSWEVNADGVVDPARLRGGRRELAEYVGVDYLSDVAVVSIGPGDDAAFRPLAAVKSLRWLCVRGSAREESRNLDVDRGLEYIKDCTKLHRIDLEASGLTDDGLSWLHGLTKLHELSVRDNVVTDIGASRIAALASIESLDVGWTRITDDGVARLASMPRLRRLDLAGTKVTGRAIRALSGLRNLEVLALDSSRIVDTELDELHHLYHLRCLSLCFTRITDASVPHLAKLVTLKELHVGCTALDQQGVRELRQALPGCKVVP